MRRALSMAILLASGCTIDPLGVPPPPPRGLTYSMNPASYLLGQPIPDNEPSTSGGGPAESYAIDPALPAGLELHTTSGIISGTPTALSPAASYMVTAANRGGPTTALLSIAVVDGSTPPRDLTYSQNPATYMVGEAITPNVPSSSGGPVNTYSVAPSLSEGLTISSSTGIISGTPIMRSSAASYTVTATNSGGSTPATLTITVNDRPPTNLTYSHNPATYTKGQAITNNVPTSSGGAVVTYSVVPSLPAGLTIDPSMGVISGTPTMVSSAASYTVTATNSGGSTQAILTITVNDQSPTGLSYSSNPVTYTKGLAIPNNVPTSSGGAVVTYSVAPPLPAGLTINPSTGVISGTPTELSSAATYTVTATNSGGSTQAMLTITVNDQSPTGLSYSSNPATYTKGLAIPNNVPTSSGGAVVTYSVAPPLPAGLTINPSTGVISGTPTELSSATTYTVTATNSGGSTQAMLTISVTGGIDSITAGYTHTCVGLGGGARCWGDNGLGQLGDIAAGGTSGHVQVFGLTSGVQAIAAGAYHTCATADGGVRCWGDNDKGQLGNNSYNGTTRPVQVTGLLSGASIVAAGSDHSCAIVNGGARCWGGNTYGQLGDSLDSGSPIPVQVTGLTSGVQAIAAGAGHTCAVVDGGARCWGDNLYGQLGNNSYLGTLAPVQVLGLTSGVQAIATGCNHTCAIVSGSARCWGDNFEGQLGDGTFNGTPTPIQPAGMASGVQAITTGCLHTCAIVNGSARCWGQGMYGQLGNNSTSPRTTSAQVVGLTSGTQLISSGYYHVCATQDGGLQCWGWNNAAQLGNSNTTTSLVPVPIAP